MSLATAGLVLVPAGMPSLPAYAGPLAVPAAKPTDPGKPSDPGKPTDPGPASASSNTVTVR